MLASYLKEVKCIAHLSFPIAVGIGIQSSYLIIDLFFVSQLGVDAVAGVTTTATVTLLVGMLGQLLGIGAAAMIGQALGAGQYALARQIFIHAGLMAVICSACIVVAGYMGGAQLLSRLASGDSARQMGQAYLLGYVPGMALHIIITVATFGLRAVGDFHGPLIAQCLSVPINLVLAPLFIFGVPGMSGLGTFGAGMATTLASATTAAVVLYRAVDHYRHFAQVGIIFRWQPCIAQGILSVGLPAGLEAVVVYIYSGLMYWLAAQLGAPTQAAVGIGLMLIQALFIPSISVAYACAPIIAYYVGANDIAKVKKVYAVALVMVISIMFCLILVCLLWRDNLVSVFSFDPQVSGSAGYVLLCLSLNFLTSGLTHVNGSILQASGRTIWSLGAVCVRLVVFAILAYVLVDTNQISLQRLCLISNLAFLLQALVSTYAVHLVLKRIFFAQVPAPVNSIEFDTFRANKERQGL